jgi:hypothetical protein
MLPLETKQTGGKLLPHSDLRGGGCFLGRYRAAGKGTGGTLRLIFRKWEGVEMDGVGSGQVAGTCEYDNEPSGSIKCGEFLD